MKLLRTACIAIAFIVGTYFTLPTSVSAQTLPEVYLAHTVISGDAVKAEATEGDLILIAVKSNINVSSATNVTVNVTQSGEYFAPVPAGTPLANQFTHGTMGNNTVTIASGRNIAFIGVATKDDEFDESNGSITFTIASGSGYTGGSVQTKTINVNDNEPDPKFSITTKYTTVSGSDYFDVSVISNKKSENTFAVNLSISSPTLNLIATQDKSAILNFAAKETIKTHRVPIVSTVASGLTNAIPVTVSIDPSDAYNVDKSKQSVLVNVVNGTSLPVLSIAPSGAISGAVSEGTPVAFAISISPVQTTATKVNYAITSVGDYIYGLTNNSVEIPANMNNVSIYIPTTSDGATTGSDGSITVTLEPGEGYKLSSQVNQQSQMVTITNDGMAQRPVLYIENKAGVDSVSVGSAGNVNAEFTVFSNVNAGTNFSINTQDTNIDGNFIASGNTGMQGKTLNFSPVTGATNLFSADLTVPVILDTMNRKSGEIMVELLNDSTLLYSVLAPRSRATLRVIADTSTLPVISIRGGGEFEEGQPGIFYLQADRPPASTLNVTVSLTDPGSFLENSSNKTVQISSTDPVPLSLPTSADNTDEANGTITATVEAESPSATTYDTDINNSATITILDNDIPNVPVITVAGPASIDEGQDAEFVFTAMPAPESELVVDFDILVEGIFFPVGFVSDRIEKTVTISTDGEGRFSQATIADIVPEDDGSITAFIRISKLNPTSYSVGTQFSAEIDIEDNDIQYTPNQARLPILSVVASEDIVEGHHAIFSINASEHVVKDMPVRILISQTGDFLDADQLGIKTITFEGSPVDNSVSTQSNFHIYQLATELDLDPEPDGSVSLTILSDSNATPKYTVGATPRATVVVTDDDTNDNLVVGVASDFIKTGVTISKPFDFTVFTSKPVENDLRISFSVTKSVTSLPNIFTGQFNTSNLTVNDFVIPKGARRGRYTVNLVDCTICNAANPGNYIVAITSSNDYQVHATSGSINIPVKQNGSTGTFPVISLSSTSTTISGGDNASITLTSDKPINNLVYYRLYYENAYEQSSYQDRTKSTDGVVTASSLDVVENGRVYVKGVPQRGSVAFNDNTGPSYTFSFNIATPEFDKFGFDRRLTVQLIDSEDYVLAGTGTTDIPEVKIDISNSQTISVTAIKSQINEGEFLEYRFTPSAPVDKSFDIEYRISETVEGDFLPTNLPDKLRIFKNKAYTDHVILTTIDDMPDAESTVTLEILSGVGYGVGAKNTAIVTVTNVAESTYNPPEFSVSFSSQHEYAYEGETVLFTLSVYAPYNGNPANTENLTKKIWIATNITPATMNSRTVLYNEITLELTKNQTDDFTLVPFQIPNSGGTPFGQNAKYNVTILNPDGAVLTFAQAQMKFEEDDDSLPTLALNLVDADNAPVLSIADTNGVEGEKMAFTVSLDKLPHVSFAVNYALADGTARRGFDYGHIDGSAGTTGVIWFEANEMTNQILVDIYGDGPAEEDETLTVTLSDPTNGIKLSSNVIATGTILAENTAVITTANSVTVNEGDGNLEIEIELHGTSSNPVTLKYTTSDDTAMGGQDFTAQDMETYTHNSATPSPISIPITNDTIYEGEESFTVTLSDVQNAQFPGNANEIVITVTLVDNDAIPVIQIISGTPNVTEADNVTLDFTVQTYQDVTDANPNNHITTTAAKEEFVAKLMVAEQGNFDFIADSDEKVYDVTFAAGMSTANSISISIVNDDLYENAIASDGSPETNDGMVKLTLMANTDVSPAKYTVTTAASKEAAITIQDDDSAPVIEIADLSSLSLTEGNAFNITFNVDSTNNRSTAAATDTVIRYTVTDSSFFIGASDRGAHTITLPANMTSVLKPIAINENNIYQGDGSIVITIENDDKTTATYTRSATQYTETVSITDDDPLPQIQVFASTTTVNEGQAITFTYIVYQDATHTTAASAKDFNVRVSIVESSGDFIHPNPNPQAPKLVKFLAGASMARDLVTIHDDEVDEANGSITLSILPDSSSNAQYTFRPSEPGASTYKNEKVITVIDNDVPKVSISRIKEIAFLSDGSFMYMVSANPAPFEEITVNLMIEQTGMFIDQESNLMVNSTIKIPKDETEETGTVMLNQTGTVEDDSMITIKVASGEGYEPVSEDTANADKSNTITISVERATLPELSISASGFVTEGTDMFANFTVSSTILPIDDNNANTLVITYYPESDNFLSGNINEKDQMTSPLMFTEGTDDITATLPVSIEDDQTAEANGSIMVTLKPVQDKYLVASGDAAIAEIIVIDNDSAMPELTISGPVGPVIEDAGSVTFTLTASVDPKRSLVVNYTPSEGDVVGVGNFLDDDIEKKQSTSALAFEDDGSGNIISKFTVDLVNDDVAENSGEISVTLELETVTDNALRTYTLPDNGSAATARILDDEPRELTITAGDDVYEDDIEPTADFIITANLMPVGPIAVRYTPVSANFLALNESEETVTTPPLTFRENNGIITAPLSVEVHVDDEVDPDGTIMVTLENDTNLESSYVVGSPASASVNVYDQRLSLYIENASIIEGNLDDDGNSVETALNFEVSISPATNKPISLKWGTSIAGQDNATSGVDFIAASNQTLEFMAGESTKNISVMIKGDTDPESNETFTVTLSDIPGGIIVERATATGTILNDEASYAPELTIAAGEDVYEDDTQPTADFIITADSMPAEPIAVSYTPVSTSFLAPDESGEKVTSLPLPFNFKDGKVTATLSVPVHVDDEADPAGTIMVTLEDDSNTTPLYTVGTPALASVTVYDQRITLNIESASIIEGNLDDDENPEQTILNFAVTMSPATNKPITLKWGTSIVGQNNATAGEDFVPAIDQPLEFLAGESTKNFTVVIRGDIDPEPNETFTVTLSDIPAGMIITNNVATGTILNDEVFTPELTITAGDDVYENDLQPTADFTITANSMPAGPIAVRYTPVSANYLADGASGVMATSTPLTFSLNNGIVTAILRVAVDVDQVPDPAGTIMVTLESDTNTSPLYSVGTPASASVNVYDNQIFLSIESASIVEGDAEDENNKLLNFKVTISPVTDRPIKLRWGTAIIGQDNATPGEDFRSTRNQILEFMAGESAKEISVMIIGDDIHEPSELFSITFSQIPTGIIITNATAKGIILNNDNLVEERYDIAIFAGSESVFEGSPANFRLRSVQEIPSDGLEISFSVSQEGSFLAWRIPQRFIMSESSDTLTIQTIDDTTIEDSGSITVTLEEDTENPSIQIDSNFDSATITIKDNDRKDLELPRISVATAATDAILTSFGNAVSSPPQTSAPAFTVTRPLVSITSVDTQIDEGASARFLITSRNGNLTTNFTIYLQVNQERVQIESPTTLRIQLSGQETRPISIATTNDSHADEDGFVSLSILENPDYLVSSSASSAEVIVSDAIDRQNRKSEITARTQSFLPELTGVIGANTLETVSNRIELGFSENGNQVLEFGGQNSISGMLTASGDAINESSTTLKSFLGSSSFAFSLSEDNFAIPTTIWGVGDYQNLSSIDDGKVFDWSGDLFMGHFGIDALIRDGLLTGISASVAESEINFDSVDSNNIQFDFRTTSLDPYIGWTSSNQNTKLNATAGFGQGEIGIDQKDYSYETLNSEFYTMGLSGSQVLFTSDSILNGTSNLSIKGESWFAHHSIDGKDGVLESISTNSQHFRIKTEGTHQFDFATGSSLRPLVSVGIRSDGKDNLSVLGLEYTGGVDYKNPIGLTLAGNGSMLVGRDYQIQKLRLGSSITFDMYNDKRGLILDFAPTWGQTSANAQNTLWNRRILDASFENEQFSEGTSLSSEIGYSLEILQGNSVIAPFGGFEYSGMQGNEYQVGTRMSFGSRAKLDLIGTQNASSYEGITNKVEIEGSFSW